MTTHLTLDNTSKYRQRLNNILALPAIVKKLYAHHPNLKYYLNFNSPYQLVIATILSPQVRDEVVNKVTPTLYAKYPTPEKLARADFQTLVKEVVPVTFAGAKTKHLIGAGKTLHEKFHGRVPNTLDELTELPGVGEKTAHAILQNAFGIIEGICVDTHVLRVSHRIGLTSNPKNAKKTEDELKQIIPQTHWKNYPSLMKAHGRATCTAPIPKCSTCPVEKLCPKKGVTVRK